MTEWVPSAFLTAFLILILKLWRDFHTLDKRITKIENERQLRKEIGAEELTIAMLETFKGEKK